MFGGILALMWVRQAHAQPVQPAQETGAPHEKPRILLLEDSAHPRVGLFASLKIQLADRAEVERRADLQGEGVGERVKHATELGEREGFSLVVWSDEPIAATDGSAEAVLYAVGQRQGRALLQVVRVPGGAGPDMDRSLALKVGDVIDEQERARKLQTDLLTLAPPPAAPHAPPPSAAGTRWANLIAIGIVAAPARGSQLGQWGASASLGPTLQRDALRAAALLELAWLPAFRAHAAGSSIALRQVTSAISLGLSRKLGDFWLGSRAGLGLSFVDVDGESPLGTRATRSLRALSWHTMLDIDAPLAVGFGLRFGFGLQGHFVHRKFTINGREITDLADLRPAGLLALTWHP